MSKVCIPKFSFAVYLFNAFGKCLPLTPWAQYLCLHTIDENSKKWKWEPVSFYLWVISQTLYKCKITYDHKRNNQPVRLTEEQQFHFVCLVSNQKPTHLQLVSTLTTKTSLPEKAEPSRLTHLSNLVARQECWYWKIPHKITPFFHPHCQCLLNSRCMQYLQKAPKLKHLVKIRDRSWLGLL